jgi:hypothetical protein
MTAESRTKVKSSIDKSSNDKKPFIKYCKLIEKLAEPESKLLEDICRQMPLRER